MTTYRYARPVASPPAATTALYDQLRTDFGFKPPTILVLSSAPDLMAATWGMLREALLAGAGARRDREIIAAGVSLANRCPFCVDSHAMMLHATGDHDLAETLASGERPSDPRDARLLDWSVATRTPGAPELAEPPFGAALLPSYAGTALTFHFINRMVSVLLGQDVLPGNLQRSKAVRSLSGRAFARTVRREPAPGASLPLLGDRGPSPAWAGDAAVGPAYAALRTAATRGGDLLDRAARGVVLELVAASDGSHPPLRTAWLDDEMVSLPAATRPGARLAALAALAPYRVTVADVTAWRAVRPADADLVRLVAFGAFAATDRVETAVTGREVRRH